MRHIELTIILISFCNIGCAQTDLELTQGFWEEEVEGFQSYVVVEDNYWYSVTLIDGSIDVSREWFGFYNKFDSDSIHPKSLSDTGRYIVFLADRKSIKDYDTSLERGYFNFYEFDLDDDYFVYYGNSPVTLDRIDSLPEKVNTYFLQEREKMDKTRILN